MTRDQRLLPHQAPVRFLSDGGMETELVFHEGRDLPEFAAFTMLETEADREWLRCYFRRYLDLAAATGLGFVLETPTWRANPRYARRLGHDALGLAELNTDAVALLAEVREEYAGRVEHALISGCIGPRGDGYVPDQVPTIAEAAAYHAPQIRALADAGADLVTSFTIPNGNEAAGIAVAAATAGIPCVVGVTVETDGHLPTGEPLREAIARIDAAAATPPIYYMINCAHPIHILNGFDDGDWTGRVRAIRANASTCSHAELEAMETLDEGDPVDLAARYRDLAARLPQVVVFGGCCGTDIRHITWIAEAVADSAAA